MQQQRQPPMTAISSTSTSLHRQQPQRPQQAQRSLGGHHHHHYRRPGASAPAAPLMSQSDLEHYEWRAKGRKLDCIDSLSEFPPMPATSGTSSSSSNSNSAVGGGTGLAEVSAPDLYRESSSSMSSSSSSKTSATLNLASQLLYRAASSIVGDHPSSNSTTNSTTSTASAATTLTNSTTPTTTTTTTLATPATSTTEDSIAETKHTILQRITSILDRGGKVSAADLNDSEFRQFWMPDSNCKECYECGVKFTTFRRRHHCRICGRIFCATCCNLDMIKKHKDDIDLRVCQYCAADILNYLKSKNLSRIAESATTNMDISRRESDSFREEAFWPLQDNSSNFVAVAENCTEDTRDADESADISVLWKRTLEVFPFQNHRLQEFSYPNTATGTSLVTWIQTELGIERAVAVAVGQQLIDAGLLETVGQPSVKQFVDATILYRPVGFSADDATTEKEGDNADPLWVAEIAQDSRSSSDEQLATPDWMSRTPAAVQRSAQCPGVAADNKKLMIKCDSAFQLDLNLKQSFASVSRTQLELDADYGAVEQDVEAEEEMSRQAWDVAGLKRTTTSDVDDDAGAVAVVAEALLPSAEQGDGQPDDKAITESELNEIRQCFDTQYSHMEKEMLNQQLAANGLNQSWADVITPIVHRVAGTVVPPPTHNDIRHFVHVKKIPGGAKKDTSIVWGAAFSKNLVHKGMRCHIERPKVLILQGAITYQRNESKMDTLEPIVMQEQDCVKNATGKIKGYRPDVLIVEKSVSWLVREKVRELNVSLIINVKRSVMDRLAHLTGSTQLTGLDALGKPTLGTCDRFTVRQFSVGNGKSKSITIFSGCPEQLGCSVLLRGGSLVELSKLKRVLKFMIFMNYNWKLEKAFLLDELAVPPIKGALVDDEDDMTESTTDLVNNINNNNNNNNSNNIHNNNSSSSSPSPSSTPPPVVTATSSVVEIRELEPEAVEDNSDPLRSVDAEKYIIATPISNATPSKDDEQYYTHAQFRNVLKNTLLSISPFLRVSPPYMETAAGAACPLRHYLPAELYSSEKLQPPRTSIAPMMKMEPASPNLIGVEAWTRRDVIEVLEAHPFLALPASTLAKGRLRDDRKFRALLADYRARGARIKKVCKCSVVEDKLLQQQQQLQQQQVDAASKQTANHVQHRVASSQDCFSPHNHQQMVVLFFSYSSRSKNAPSFCIDPCFRTMDFYGTYDITLGEYLERFCLQPEYACQCGLEMVHHNRKFVHDTGSIVLNTYYLDKMFLAPNRISMWSFCSKCRYMSRVGTMSDESRNLSFAKYLELRFHGAAYTCRGSATEPCGHSLHHDHYHYFATGHIVAAFKYVPITIREIVLPPTTIHIKKQDLNVSKVSDEILELSEKSSEFYQTVLQALMGIKEQVAGTKHELWLTQMLDIHREQKLKSKDHIEKLNVQLTTPAEGEAEVCWLIFDSLVRLKTHIADGVQTWNGLLTNFELARKKEEKTTRSETISSSTKPAVDVTVVGPLDNDSVDQTEVICDPVKLIECQDARKSISPSLSIAASDPPELDEMRAPSLTEEKGSLRSDELSVSVDSKVEKRGTVKTIFSQFLNTGTSTFVQSPFPASEHYNLNLGMDPPVVVYDTEPSSIIAASLASGDYQSSLAKVQTQLRSIVDHLRETGPNSDIDLLEVTNFTLPQTATSKPEQAQLHIDIQFQDASSRYFCRIYFAEQFRQVRRLLFATGEERFIYSLARCISWQAQGGKSGSEFRKTLDDRFILKGMCRSEMDCVRREFGVKYFDYIYRASKKQHPTVLGKIVGVYRICYTNSATNSQQDMYLLVMENLFYERNIVQKFDLKGSERNRLVNDAEREDVVLLDENFMRQMCDHPLYIRQHSKKVLLAAINNDSSFLAECKVMDYSLLVGIDAERNEFVVGIIDYVRQFTWDKKAEMLLKSALSGKSPTVIWPAEYKSRFQRAMDKYFLAVPDRWTPMGRDSTYHWDRRRTLAS